MDKRQWIKYGALGAVIVLALGFAFRNLTGDKGPHDWYYDLSEGKLYAAPLGSITPLPGIGGEGGDGVEAKVVAPEGRCGDKAARKIGYLVTYTEEYRRLKEEASKTGQPNQTGERAFQAANTLVRRVTDTEWFPASSAEGERVINEFNDLMMGTTDGVKYKPCKP